MSAIEALTVTALGIGIVFAGLVLCIAFVVGLRHVAARVSVGGGSEHQTAAAARLPASDAPVPADVLAVLVAVLEVERALYVGRYRSRLTLTHPSRRASAVIRDE